MLEQTSSIDLNIIYDKSATLILSKTKDPEGMSWLNAVINVLGITKPFMKYLGDLVVNEEVDVIGGDDVQGVCVPSYLFCIKKLVEERYFLQGKTVLIQQDFSTLQSLFPHQLETCDPGEFISLLIDDLVNIKIMESKMYSIFGFKVSKKNSMCPRSDPAQLSTYIQMSLTKNETMTLELKSYFNFEKYSNILVIIPIDRDIEEEDSNKFEYKDLCKIEMDIGSGYHLYHLYAYICDESNSQDTSHYVSYLRNTFQSDRNSNGMSQNSTTPSNLTSQWFKYDGLTNTGPKKYPGHPKFILNPYVLMYYKMETINYPKFKGKNKKKISSPKKG
jgi:hypothetical protein